jgi:hypothetical protein
MKSAHYDNYICAGDCFTASACDVRRYVQTIGSRPQTKTAVVDMTNISSANNTLSINDYYDYTERPETYIVPVLFAIIFVVGMIGNVTLVLIFVRNKQMRNVPNIYIINLALGDLLVIVSCVPFTSTVYTVRILNFTARDYNIITIV